MTIGTNLAHGSYGSLQRVRTLTVGTNASGALTSHTHLGLWLQFALHHVLVTRGEMERQVPATVALAAAAVVAQAAKAMRRRADRIVVMGGVLRLEAKGKDKQG